MNKRDENIIFIVGFPRSGTTLLASILNKHSNITVPPETHFFSRFSRSISFPVEMKKCSEVVTSLISYNRIKDLELTEKEVIENLNLVNDKIEKSDLFIALIQAYGKRYNTSCFVEKTPVHMLETEKLIQMFPNIKIISLVRDGRDSILSLLNAPWHHNNVSRHAAEWSYRMELIEGYVKRYPDKFIAVSFEDILSTTERTMKKICSFAGIKFENSMLENSNKISSVVPNWEKEWKGKVDKKIDKTRIFPWKKYKDKNTIDLMSRIMKLQLLNWGYSLPEHNIDKVIKFKNIIISLFFINIYKIRKLKNYILALFFLNIYKR